MTPQQVAELIQTAIPDATIQVEDFGVDSGDHFKAEVRSNSFRGLSLVDQHRKVYAALNEYMADERIHALSLTTGTLD